MKSRITAFTCGIVLLIASCATNTPATPSAVPVATLAPTHTATTAQSRASGPLSESVCRVPQMPSNATCYDLVVPERHAQPAGRSIKLHVAVFRSGAADRLDDPILFLMGGPGQPGILSFVWSRSGFKPFHSRRDVIALDQRGTGASDPMLSCPEHNDFLRAVYAKQLADDESLKLENAAFQACHDRLVKDGVDLSAYNSAAVAADVEVLRQALGVKQWNLYGWSYGARVAMTVLRDHPRGVRSVVLDSPYPPRSAMLVKSAKYTQDTLQRMFDRCKALAACNAAFPKLETEFYELLDKLDAKPAQVGNVLVTGDRFIDVILTLYFDQYSLLHLPKLIHTTYSGDTSLLSQRAGRVFGLDDYFADGLQMSSQCTDEFRVIAMADVTAGMAGVQPRLARYFESKARGWLELCALWLPDQPTPVETVPVVSDIPTLLLVGDADPATPPEVARAAAATLRRSQLVEFTGFGHGLFTADLLTGQCVSGLVDAFLSKPEDKLDQRCVTALIAKPRNFIAP